MSGDRGSWLSDIPEWLLPLIITATVSLIIVDWDITKFYMILNVF